MQLGEKSMREDTPPRFSYSDPSSLLSSPTNFNFFTVQPATESSSLSPNQNKISPLSSCTEVQVAGDRSPRVHGLSSLLSTNESMQRPPWRTQWKKIYSAMKSYKTQKEQLGLGLGLGIGLGLQTDKQKETRPSFMDPQDLHSNRPQHFFFGSKPEIIFKSSSIVSPSLNHTTSLSTSRDLKDITVLDASRQDVTNILGLSSHQENIQLLEDSNVQGEHSPMQIEVAANLLIDSSPSEIAPTENSDICITKVHEAKKTILPSKRQQQVESNEAPKRKSQRLFKVEKMDPPINHPSQQQTVEDSMAITLLEMHSGSFGKEKKSKGKEKITPYSRPPIHPQGKSKAASEASSKMPPPDK